MDTSDLASSVSLGSFLLVFTYLSLAEYTKSPGVETPHYSRSWEQLSRSVTLLRLLRLSCVVAVALSVQVLMSTHSPGVGINAGVGVGLLAFLVTIDRGTCVISTRVASAASKLSSPFHLLFGRRPSLPASVAASEPDWRDGREQGGDGANSRGGAPVVITEEEQVRLDARARLMIRSILRLDESTVREVMVPRADMVAVEEGTPLLEIAERVLGSGHSRLPVYSEILDNITGVVYSRDLLPFLSATEEYPPLTGVMRPAFFIPESKRVDELLRELQKKRIQMAIVVDEYGGVEGLVTLEDLLEEIVGEIEDEFSPDHEPRVVPLASGEVIVDARVSLDYLSDLFSTFIEHDDVDTVGGLVYSTLGKIPQVGDEIVYDGLRIEVVSLLGRRIRKLRLNKVAISEGSLTE